MDAFCLYFRTQEGYHAADSLIHATTAKNKSQRKDRWIDDGPCLPDDFKKKKKKKWGGNPGARYPQLSLLWPILDQTA